MKRPVRLAILIGSQSPGSTLLPGVNKDIANLIAFLMSPVGGAWQRQEIIVLQNPTCSKVLTTILNARADYLFTYFSGHGITDSQGRRMLAVADGGVHDIQLLNFYCTRQVLFADSCLTHERSAAIGSIPWPGEQWHYFDGYSWARDTFDQHILQSPAGHLIIYATQDKYKAYDSPNGLGGEFTLALLQSVSKYQRSGQEGLLYIPTVIDYATHLLQQKGVPQTPSYVFHQGNFQVPLAIVSPQFVYAKPRANTIVKEKDNSVQNALLLGLAIVVIASL